MVGGTYRQIGIVSTVFNYDVRMSMVLNAVQAVLRYFHYKEGKTEEALSPG